MAGNTLGRLFCVTTFGESHGPAIGCVIDGCPPGLALSETDIQPDLDRRRPGTSRHVTQRQEADRVEILSGVFEGRTTGTPIALLIRNEDARSKDYGNIAADFPARPRRLHLLPEVRHARLPWRRPLVGAADGAGGGGGRGGPQVARRRRTASWSAATCRSSATSRCRSCAGRTWRRIRSASPTPPRSPQLEAYLDRSAQGRRLLRRAHRGRRQRHPGRAGRAALRQARCRHRPCDDGHQRRQGRRDRRRLRQRRRRRAASTATS